MEEDNQSAQSVTETNTVTTTNCSICRGKRIDKREAINRALGKGISYRDIEAMTGVAYRTIGNHAQHLPAIFKEAKEKGILQQPIDVWKEFGEQLAFAKELRAAAAAWLRCPETGKITLEPLALIFHLLDCVSGKQSDAITLETAERAAAWCSYLQLHD